MSYKCITVKVQMITRASRPSILTFFVDIAVLIDSVECQSVLITERGLLFLESGLFIP